MLKIMLTIAGVFFTIPACAAPFCAVFSFGKQCYYYDMNDCRRAAGRDGMCVVNQDEIKSQSGGAPFCVVSAYGARCYYYDADSCRREAAASGGACVAN